VSADRLVFEVERCGLFDWHVYARSFYRGWFIGSFWTQRGAEAVASRLNAAEVSWPAVRREEEEYVRSLPQVIVTQTQMPQAIVTQTQMPQPWVSGTVVGGTVACGGVRILTDEEWQALLQVHG
jgi:hypothetical protein